MERQRRYLTKQPRWNLVLLGVLAYVGLGQIVNYIPNPMVPRAILALNMVVPIVVGYFDGPLSGIWVGLLGTGLNVLLKLAVSGLDLHEAIAILPHAFMGGVAGYAGRKRARIGTALTIFVGHGLNILGYLISGLLPLSQLGDSTFWTGLTAETVVEMILILFSIGAIQRVGVRRQRSAIERIKRRTFWIRGGSIALLSLLLAVSYLIGVGLASYFFIIPVVLAAVGLGVLEAWLTALILSALLGWAALSKGLLAATQETSHILVLNLVALVVGELVGNVRKQQRLAQRRAERLAVVNRIARAASATLHLDDLMEVLYQEITATFEPDAFFIALYDAEAEALDYCLQIDEGMRLPPERRPVGTGLTSRVIEKKKPLLIENLRNREDLMDQAEPWGTMKPSLSWVGTPMQVGDRVVGVLSIQAYAPYAYDREEELLLSTIAEQAAVAIENARLYQEVQHQADDLADAVAQLQELDRLKSEFIQNVSHELRSPLGLIRGYAELLASEELGELSPEQRGPVEVITRRAKMLGDMVEDITLILLTETRPLVREPVAVEELARSAVDDFHLVADQAGLELQAEIVPDLAPVKGEATSLRRVLDNLIGNAIKFTPAGGRITTRVWQEDARVILTVTDTGIGIPSEKQARCFERFYQVDGSSRRRYQGAGLGLALVKEIVKAHGGTVGVTSEVGKGSTFTVTLPIGEEEGA